MFTCLNCSVEAVNGVHAMRQVFKLVCSNPSLGWCARGLCVPSGLLCSRNWTDHLHACWGGGPPIVASMLARARLKIPDVTDKKKVFKNI